MPRLHVEVVDDLVVPLGEAAGIHSDHVEPNVSAQDSVGNPSGPRKLGILLAADGVGWLPYDNRKLYEKR